MREDIIGQEEEVAQLLDQRLAALGVLLLVEIQDHSEHYSLAVRENPIIREGA
jgi:hypothetical protein